MSAKEGGGKTLFLRGEFFLEFYEEKTNIIQNEILTQKKERKKLHVCSLCPLMSRGNASFFTAICVD